MNCRRTCPILLAIVPLCLAAAAAQDTATETPISYFYSAGPGALIQASDGNFYGTSSDGGHDAGSVYQITPSGVIKQIYVFNYATDGQTPSGPLVEGPDGQLYGTMLHGGNNGAYSCGAGFTCGTAYKLTTSGTFTLLYTFTGAADGYSPGPLALGDDGNFYGTTQYGGGPANDCEGSYYGGCGTVFRLTPSGQLSTIFTFLSDGSSGAGDGGYPYGQMVQASNGSFYGNATLFNYVPQEGQTLSTYYILFSVSKGGGEETIFQSPYSNTSDPSLPSSPGLENFNSPLTEGSDLNLYGGSTTGAVSDNTFSGALFKMPLGGNPVILYQFPGAATGTADSPDASLFLGGDGLFYGSAAYSGANGYGSSFNMTYAGAVTDLHDFPANYGDGSYPGQLLQGADGSFYGTSGGGGGASGTAFRMTVSPAPPAPVQLSLSQSTIVIGNSSTLSWTARNAFSLTLQQCYLFATVDGASFPEGKLTGTLKNDLFSGSVTLTPPATGTYLVAVTCGGQESGFANLTVNGLPSDTALAAAPNPATVGQSVTLTATVTSTGTAPGGTVTFSALGTTLGTATLDGGVATFTSPTTGVAGGSYAVTARYSGDSTHATSTGSATVVLNDYTTATALTVSPSSVKPPAGVTATATVKRAHGSGAVSGSVTFYADDVEIGTGNVNSSGVATLTHSSSGVGAGTYSITAKYSGDSLDSPSTSSAVNVAIQ